jgi:hypothetical protein
VPAKLPLTLETVETVRAASPCHGALHLAVMGAVRPQRALEIGAGFGRSTMFLALGLHRLGGPRVLDSVDIDQRVPREALARFDTAPLLQSRGDVNPYVPDEVAAFRLAYRVFRGFVPAAVFLRRTKSRLKKLIP